MGLGGGSFFQFSKICLHFSAVCLQFFQKNTTSQTHFGFTNMGSNILTLEVTAHYIYFFFNRITLQYTGILLKFRNFSEYSRFLGFTPSSNEMFPKVLMATIFSNVLMYRNVYLVFQSVCTKSSLFSKLGEKKRGCNII